MLKIVIIVVIVVMIAIVANAVLHAVRGGRQGTSVLFSGTG